MGAFGMTDTERIIELGECYNTPSKAAVRIAELERELAEQKRLCDAMHEDLHSHDERREWAERELADAHDHYQPQIDDGIRMLNEANAQNAALRERIASLEQLTQEQHTENADLVTVNAALREALIQFGQEWKFLIEIGQLDDHGELARAESLVGPIPAKHHGTDEIARGPSAQPAHDALVRNIRHAANVVGRGNGLSLGDVAMIRDTLDDAATALMREGGG